ncbi:ribonuclease 3 [Harpegnathos saltator]|uniref:Ribonuclease 3 n=1 Tax=Harpegnathos saltator TaxID=610380 RepID=E2BFD6_HARSA|nr:ribonuclease 3 [Harpegnathos saltator]XP_011137728.1 ribonuclease 3 [Harpegnathos saltator]XP_011137729.1 ribonuclease 3 [Harpegnathos saltator]XP_011137730.1 ribonuclease 3 [Harpegnathos saltator]XP_011137731.1 ribonuclease 3 [Harpegnathos saltator]EFN85596.1 Ribonuclease 3 [Harpegnathos saltator]
MANPPSMNMNQEYYWNSETTQQNMEYYPTPSYPPPNYNQPSNYDSFYSYNATPNMSEIDSTTSVYRSAPPPVYHSGPGNIHNVPYQNQMNQQCNLYQNNTNFPQQPVNENYNADWNTNTNTNTNARGTYNVYNENQAYNEWPSNNSTTNWTTYQNTSTSWYDPNKAYNNEKYYPRRQYEPQQQTKKPEWKYDYKESLPNLPNYTNGRNRSRSPSSSGRSEKSYRSRCEDYKEKYKYDIERSSSREYKYKSRDFERRSSYKRHESHQIRSSHSETYASSKCRKRSRSQESHVSKDETQTSNSTKRKCPTERELLLEKYRRNYCATSKDIERKLDELSAMGSEGILESERKIWTRTAPADLYYSRDENNPKIMRSTSKLLDLCAVFKKLLIDRAAAARALQPPYKPPPRKTRARLCRHKSEACSSSSDSDSDSSMDEDDRTMEELMAKKQHPQRLHPEMWFNDPGEMNDGPLCRCSAKSRRSGIRHGIYAGEGVINKCDLNSNNADKLHHYRITISPPTNFLTKTPTIIKHDEHEFIFEGFSMLSHFPLVKLPTCKVIRFNIEYTILYIEEKLPENFTIQELDYFQTYLFREILELVDFDLQAAQDKSGCGQFHFMPRFVRDLTDNGQEILSMNEVLNYLIKSSTLLINPDDLPRLVEMPQYKWQDFADEVKGMVVTYPGKKPCSVRVDQLDRSQVDQPPGVLAYPEIVHFGIRPPQLSYAGNADYQKAWRDYVKFRHLLANMSKPSYEDKRKLEAKENRLQELRTQSKMKRDVTVDVTSDGFYRTGIMCDIVQHAMLIPVLVCHLRFHKSLDNLECTLGYEFKNRYLLQLALTHPSYRENFGTNPDHARNSLTNCGIRQPEYGDRRIHYMNTRKRGINTLINIMSRFGARTETESSIAHNERLEFLGDAVVEFLTSIHLFHMFPDLEEGGLATYRAAIVQNQHLAVLAKKLNLEEYMLYAHGSDLCHDLELRHAMANCFEALMGSLFLDGGIEVADRVFGETLFKDEEDLAKVWVNYPRHPLQEQEPMGDRQWIPSFELLQKLTKFEESIGIKFTHIRLLARAFTDRSIGYTNLTLGSNQRLEFLGDTVLQLIVSEYLYKFFPEHHEGHLSLLRSSLVNNKTQAVVCDDLGMTQYALYGNPKAELKTKDRADLLEAFLGALYVDKGFKYCHVFCDVCFFPRLQDFIMNQDWNDPKSKLQQCCLTLRTMDGGEPDIPVYKVIECKGPTNTRVYTVAVYFQGKRLAKASGHSIQEAEMNSAKEALEKSQDLFPQLDHQKRVIAKSMKMQQWTNKQKSKGKPAESNDKSDDSDSSQNRRSRSKERNAPNQES